MSLIARRFLSMSVQMTLQACNIAKQFSVDKTMKKFQKGHDDHATQADYKIQSMLIKGFNMHFPGLRIIGEQTQQYKGSIDFDYSKLRQDFLDPKLQINAEENISECCIWIDPIDCTKGFIEGTLEDVTVLVGMSTNNRPALGVIGIPFKKVNEQRIFDPEILIGSVKDQKAYSYHNSEWTQLKKTKRNAQQLTITTSVSRSNQMQQMYLKHMNAKKFLTGGSGRKVIFFFMKVVLLIKGETDMMAYVGAAISKWDSCAGDAIIKAMGGNFTTPLGTEISYDTKESLNPEGIFCSFDTQIHDKSIQFMKNHKADL